MFLTQHDLTALQDGSSQMQQRFWKAFWDEIYAICRHILGKCPDATEVAVDTMSDFLVKYVHQLSTPNAVRAYLRLMATRRSLKYREKRDRFIPLPDHDVLDEDTRSPEESANISLMSLQLYECMGELTPKAQKVLSLRFKKQFANEKIGELVGGSRQYIGRLVKQSIQLLRNCLEVRDNLKQGGA